MGTLDFLFNGQAPPTTTTGSTSTTSVPTWLQQYTQGLLSQANAVASQPYQPYQGPRVAGFTDAQKQAQSAISGLQGAQNGTLAQAGSLATSAANPGAISTGLGMIPQAQSYINRSVAPSATDINPYEQNVVKQAEDRATQYWNDTLQPSINNQFTAAGQFGSSANQRAQGLAAKEVTQNIQDTAGAALAQGYTNAQQSNLAAGQATGALGQLAGGLGYEQGVLGMQGASTLGNLATTGQNLGLQAATALDTSGGEQQQLNQANLNTGYQDFLNQVQYPQQQLSWLTGIESGAPSAGSSTAQSGTGFAPAYSASPLSQAIGLYGALNPTPKAGSARGGVIRRRTQKTQQRVA